MPLSPDTSATPVQRFSRCFEDCEEKSRQFASKNVSSGFIYSTVIVDTGAVLSEAGEREPRVTPRGRGGGSRPLCVRNPEPLPLIA
jgi:hypothetical protein